MRVEKNGRYAAIVGIGVNVNQTAADFSEQLRANGRFARHGRRRTDRSSGACRRYAARSGSQLSRAFHRVTLERAQFLQCPAAVDLLLRKRDSFAHVADAIGHDKARGRIHDREIALRRLSIRRKEFLRGWRRCFALRRRPDRRARFQEHQASAYPSRRMKFFRWPGRQRWSRHLSKCHPCLCHSPSFRERPRRARGRAVATLPPLQSLGEVRRLPGTGVRDAPDSAAGRED